MPIKAEEFSKALRLPFDSKTSIKDVKENLAKWIVDNFTNIKYFHMLS